MDEGPNGKVQIDVSLTGNTIFHQGTSDSWLSAMLIHIVSRNFTYLLLFKQEYVNRYEYKLHQACNLAYVASNSFLCPSHKPSPPICYRIIQWWRRDSISCRWWRRCQCSRRTWGLGCKCISRSLVGNSGCPAHVTYHIAFNSFLPLCIPRRTTSADSRTLRL